MTPFDAGFTLIVAAVAGDAYVAQADRLVIAGTPIQLIGVDAPPPNTQPGRDARAAIQSIIEDRVVICHVLAGDADDVIRMGVCFVGEDDLGALLIENGYALDCPRTSEGRYTEIEPHDSRTRLTQKSSCQLAALDISDNPPNFVSH